MTTWNLRQWLIFSVAVTALAARAQWTQAQTANAGQVLDKIRSGEITARLKAIEQLGESPTASPEVLDALREMYLGDSNEQVRRAARVALGEIHRKLRKGKGLPKISAPFAFSTAKSGSSSGITVTGPKKFGFGDTRTFSREDYVEPPPPTERVAKLISRLSADPRSSIEASKELAGLGDEAVSASGALIEVMMRGQPAWREARLAATEALEKINPELQKPVWTIIVEQSTDMGRVSNSLAEINQLGPHGRPAMPVVLAYWNAPEETGFRVEAFLLETMHIIGLTDPKVTEELVRVLRKQVSVGANCRRYAIEISDQRDLTPEQLLELLSPYAINNELSSDATGKMMQLVDEKKLAPEAVAQVLIRCLENDVDVMRNINHLGHLGGAAKEAVPILKRFKFEHSDRRVREDAEKALNLIER